MSNTKQHFLDLFFYPESVAVVGASRNIMSPNYFLVANLVKLGFPGRVYPVNPNSEEIMGLKAYPNLRSIPGEVDLAVISVPARATLGVVRDCVAKKVKAIVIIAGGFSEIGEEGKRIQEEILTLIRENGIRAVGPNALSPVNTANNFIIGFGPVEEMPRGGLSFIFQSGLYQPRLNWLLHEFNLRLNKLIDLGNKMDINEVDALEYLAQDEATKVIAIHLESIAGDARKFMHLLKETSREKPVIVLKSGRTAAGARVASSHTGAIIRSSDTVFDTALRQSGAIRVEGLDEFFDLAKAFEYLPLPKGNRVAISSFSGGEGVIATDFSQRYGLTLAELTPETQSRLRRIFPPWEVPVNPFDIGLATQFHPGEDTIGVLVDAFSQDPNVDCLAIQMTGMNPRVVDVAFQESAEKLVRLFSQVTSKGKAVVLWLASSAGGNDSLTKALESSRIPVYPSAERVVRALGALCRYALLRKGASSAIPSW